MDLSVFPRRELLRWELTVRVILALLLPITVGLVLGGGLSGVLAGLVAVLTSLAYLGPDVGSLPWAAGAAVGAAGATMLGILVSGWFVWTQALLVLVLFTLLGIAMLSGLLAQLAVTPAAFLGIIMSLLGPVGLTVGLAVQACLGAAWALLLIAVLPRWSGWPRLPIPPAALAPDTELVRRMFARPRLAEWGFPLLLGGLAVAVLYGASLIHDQSRPYWAVFGLVGVLGPSAAQTRLMGWQTVGATVLGVIGALLIFQTEADDMPLLGSSFGLGMLGVMLFLTNGLLSKALLTMFVIVLVAIATGDDPGDVGTLRLNEYLLGAFAAMLAASAAEFLARRIEVNSPPGSDVAG